jgi:tRNA modification GTPase
MTPTSPGAIGVVRVTGAAAESVVSSVFRSRGSERGGIAVGEIVSGDALVDEAVVARLGRATSGFERFDIGVHGGRGTVACLLERLAAAGARVLEIAAYRRFLLARGDHDFIWLEASEALDESLSIDAAAFLAEAAAGSLSAAIAAIESGLVAGHSAARDDLALLVAAAPNGIALASPRTAVLSGPPNAGKSTLFNALVGASRALTSPTPHTTRDSLDEIVLLALWPVRLFDTAGVGGEVTDLDRRASSESRRRAESADAVIRVVDGSRPLRSVPPGAGPIAVTHSDLPAAFDATALAGQAGGEAVRVSGATGDGLDRLAAAVVRALGLPPRPPRGPELFTRRQAEVARAALASPDGTSAAARLGELRRGHPTPDEGTAARSD